MAGGITALIAVLVAVIIIVFILLRYWACTVDSNRKIFVLDYVFLRYQKRSGRKYSFKNGNLSIMRKAHPIDGIAGEGSSGEGEEGKSEGSNSM